MQNGITDSKNYSPEALNDSLSGIVNASFALGACIGPILASSLEGSIGFPWACAVIFGVCGACVLVYFVACMSELRETLSLPSRDPSTEEPFLNVQAGS
jgi:MFS family permease